MKCMGVSASLHPSFAQKRVCTSIKNQKQTYRKSGYPKRIESFEMHGHGNLSDVSRGSKGGGVRDEHVVDAASVLENKLVVVCAHVCVCLCVASIFSCSARA